MPLRQPQETDTVIASCLGFVVTDGEFDRADFRQSYVIASLCIGFALVLELGVLRLLS